MADLTLHESLSELPAQEWDAIAAPEEAVGRPIDPFITHRFLSALETSGSTGTGSGWQARPLVLRENGRLVAATPLYVKSPMVTLLFTRVTPWIVAPECVPTFSVTDEMLA